MLLVTNQAEFVPETEKNVSQKRDITFKSYLRGRKRSKRKPFLFPYLFSKKWPSWVSDNRRSHVGAAWTVSISLTFQSRLLQIFVAQQQQPTPYQHETCTCQYSIADCWLAKVLLKSSIDYISLRSWFIADLLGLDESKRLKVLANVTESL